MNRPSCKRPTNRPRQAAAQPRRCRLWLEQLEDRCQPSVTGFSPIDQIGNNPSNLGIAGTDLLRLSPPDYRPVANGGDGLNTPSMHYVAPDFIAGPRLVSNAVSNQATVLFGSTDINTVNQNGLSAFGYTWGQFLDHDMDLTPTQGDAAPNPNPLRDGVNGFPIPVDPNHDTAEEGLDVIGSLAFTRSIFNPNTGNPGPDGITGTADDVEREQINAVTSFLDLSQVYGSTLTVSNALRGSNGRLKSSPGADGVIGTADDLLPFNATVKDGISYFTPTELAALNMANDVGAVPNSDLFAAGDVRANEVIELTALHTLFMRNHNRLAGLLAQQNPASFGLTSWTNETLFQEARKLNIAQYQTITYTGYLPALLGPTALAAYTGYDSTVNPSISNEFSTVAFRFGHSLLNNTVPRHNNNGVSIGDVSLAQSFFNPHLLTPGHTGSTSIDAILKGNADINAQANDLMAVSAIRNLLFGQGGPGEDLIARDIWRADDHGIGTYNQVRAAFGLEELTDTGVSNPGEPFRFHGFEQITSNAEDVQNLIFAFTGPNSPAFLANFKHAGDINPFVAGLAEDHVPGSDMGPLFHAILVDQFERLRDGDEFFYLNYFYTSAEASFIGAGDTLAEVIKLNTSITHLQADVFRFLAQEDGRGKGFYTGNNGQAALTGSQNGTTLTASVYNALFEPNTGLLANGATNSVLVDDNGNVVSLSFFATYANVKSFLQGNNGTMAHKLSVQLLTAMFNVVLNKVDATTSIYVPAVTLPGTSQTPSSTLQNSLMTNGVSDPSGIANIQDILDAAIAALLDTTPDGTFMDALKVCLEGINNNQAIFILN